MCDCNKLLPDGAMSTSNGRPARGLSGTTISRFLRPISGTLPRRFRSVGNDVRLQQTLARRGDEYLKRKTSQGTVRYNDQPLLKTHLGNATKEILVGLGGQMSRVVVLADVLQESFNGTADDGLAGQGI